jgi:thiamine biosynthesis lipoprotein
MRLDLGGIAAGYAVDEALKALRERGITSALVNASGDVGVSDQPPGTDGWRLGVVPDGQNGEPTRYLLIANAAVTTSGDAYQFVELDGHRYSHIVDPHTGLGLTSRISATVVAKDCITADSVATAVCVLGSERGIKFVEARPELAAMITVAEGDSVRTIESPNFAWFAAPPSSE